MSSFLLHDRRSCMSPTSTCLSSQMLRSSLAVSWVFPLSGTTLEAANTTTDLASKFTKYFAVAIGQGLTAVSRVAAFSRRRRTLSRQPPVPKFFIECAPSRKLSTSKRHQCGSDFCFRCKRGRDLGSHHEGIRRRKPYIFHKKERTRVLCRLCVSSVLLI